MEYVFWLSLFAATYSYAAYPAILLLLPKRSPDSASNASAHPIVSIIITAHNEAARIGQKITNTLAVRYPAGRREILVASDASTDATEEIAGTFEKDGVRVIRSDSRRGKEYAQLLAIGKAGGEILIFTDVGTSIPPDAVSMMVENFADQRIGAVSSEDRFVTQDGRMTGENLYVKFEMWLRALESSVNSLVGVSGSFFGARRIACQDWRTDIPSDFSVALNCYRLGYIAVSDPRVVGHYQDVKDERTEYRRKVRTAVRGMAALWAHRGVLNPVRFGFYSFQVWSHKVFRWLLPWFLILLFTSSTALAGQHAFYLAAWAAQVCLYSIAASACLLRTLRKSPLARFPYFFVLINVAAAHAALAFVAGKRFTIWTPTER
jgi:cellulose synthase/poly-beta-1,6-N-acetylglucosamine synthase-like glycosyltransferase